MIFESKHDPLVVRFAIVMAAFALLAFPAKSQFGPTGVSGALLLALLAVALLTYRDVRPPGAAHREQVGYTNDAHATRALESDVWRSERWVQDTARRGLDSLEQWRRQHDAGGR